MIRTLPLLALVAALAPPTAFAGELPGEPIFEARLRAESFEQDGFANTSEALTLRARYGWESPAVHGFKLLVEGETIEALVDDYADTVRPRPGYPGVPDPETTELNRLQLTFTGLPKTESVIGRQRLILDNARFVGNVGWRQNEQTFDAVKLAFAPAKGTTLTYAYVDRVRRPLGDGHPQGESRSDSHLFNAATETAAGKLVGYAYLVDLANAPTLSSATWGARLTGARPLAGTELTATYELELARQGEYGNAVGDFDLGYSWVSGGVKTKAGSVVSLIWERLDGNGGRGFQTPLATTHPFQGFSDVIGLTPTYGLTDWTLRGSTTLKLGTRPVKVAAEAHDFRDADGEFQVGREYDLVASTPLGKKLTLEAKGARFQGERPEHRDATRLWLSLEYKY